MKREVIVSFDFFTFLELTEHQKELLKDIHKVSKTMMDFIDRARWNPRAILENLRKKQTKQEVPEIQIEEEKSVEKQTAEEGELGLGFSDAFKIPEIVEGEGPSLELFKHPSQLEPFYLAEDVPDPDHEEELPPLLNTQKTETESIFSKADEYVSLDDETYSPPLLSVPPKIIKLKPASPILADFDGSGPSVALDAHVLSPELLPPRPKSPFSMVSRESSWPLHPEFITPTFRSIPKWVGIRGIIVAKWVLAIAAVTNIATIVLNVMGYT
jgi:hypothetical protein